VVRDGGGVLEELEVESSVESRRKYQRMEGGEKPEIFSSGSPRYVEILDNGLQRNKKAAAGDILEVVGESCSGASLKVIAGMNHLGNPSVKALQKSSEGILWRWVSEPSE